MRVCGERTALHCWCYAALCHAQCATLALTCFPPPTLCSRSKIGQTRAACTRPVHSISDAQQVLADCFLSTLRGYLRRLLGTLRAHSITDVGAAGDRTAVLMRDSYVESFPPRDRAFMRQLSDTQMFTCYADQVLG
jgi:hypothetical protein